MSGVVEQIFLARHESGPTAPIDEVEAVPGHGLVGDRYWFENGDAGPGEAITLIAAEAIDGYASDSGDPLAPGEHRRQVVTRGIDVNTLVGRRFSVGEVECEGVELCEPCNHLQKLTGRETLMRDLVHRGGLRADVVSGGTIRVGDSVRAVERDAAAPTA
ncbi:MAG: MOSC domain-containing protein [Thermoleophilaceae bacterium]